jgi:hypothetical protein
MTTITSKKIASLDPTWASYRGFSLLFDNPGETLSPLGEGLFKLDCSSSVSSELRFYKALASAQDTIGRDTLANTYLFCPLPPSSYHVTVWDGLNDGNAKDVPADLHAGLDGFLEGFPDSLLVDNPFTVAAEGSPLVLRTGWSLSFRFAGLIKWGNQVLVACLVPADEDSKRALEHIIADQEDLSARFQELCGVTRSRHSYVPHVSLGYFANEARAELATPHIAHWSEIIGEALQDTTITFKRIDLYGFTDMATFFKKA